MSQAFKSLSLFVSVHLLVRSSLAIPAPQGILPTNVFPVQSSGVAASPDFLTSPGGSPVEVSATGTGPNPTYVTIDPTFSNLGGGIEGGACQDPRTERGKLWMSPNTEHLDATDCGNAFQHYLVNGDAKKVDSRQEVVFDTHAASHNDVGRIPRAYVNGHCVLAMTMRDRFRGMHEFVDIWEHEPRPQVGVSQDEGTYHDLLDIGGYMMHKCISRNHQGWGGWNFYGRHHNIAILYFGLYSHLDRLLFRNGHPHVFLPGLEQGLEGLVFRNDTTDALSTTGASGSIIDM
ncbi:MAG: hypothetical protein LQ342_007656 [Letrouitia transgressa]|nr:MAG: hypothetical protein LQ342_007656 [Letrouitia transgressa]